MQQNRKRPWIFVGVLFFVGACEGERDGLSLELGADLTLRSSESATAASFLTDQGYEVTVTSAYLTLASAEVFPCEGASSLWRYALGGVARAHTISSPTRWGAPVVISLLDGPVEVGALEPPPATYCRAELTIGPADADAAALPSEVSMVGKSLYLAGTYHRSNEAPTPFSATSTLPVVLPLAHEPYQLSLHKRPTVSLRFTLGTITKVFDGLDFQTANSFAIAKSFLDHVAPGIRPVVQ